MFRHRVAIPSSLVRVTLLPAPIGGLDRHCLDIDAPSTPERLGLARVQSARPRGATGWAADPNAWTTNPNAPTLSIRVDVYIDGVGYNTTASTSRPDVGAAYPGYGNNHGFNVILPAAPGSHSVCAYVINSAGNGHRHTAQGSNQQIGCRTVVVGTSPFGAFNGADQVPPGIRVQGWTLDPNTSVPIQVHAYMDGGIVGDFVANVSRPDVGAAYPGYGNNHGFDAVVPVPAGIHELCLYAINSGPGTNIGIGCKMVLVNAYAPTGSIDSAVAASGGIRIQGWALDLNTVAAININITVDGATRPSVLSNVSRPDVGAYFPGFGNNHGFDTVVTTTTGSHQVCVWADNDLPAGPDVQLGCRTVIV